LCRWKKDPLIGLGLANSINLTETRPSWHEFANFRNGALACKSLREILHDIVYARDVMTF
jgi:hypothetical protein